MALADDWWEIARASSEAARILQRSGATYRSSVSRHYYAAYQAVTALLVARGRVTPNGKEGWSHPTTAKMLYEELLTFGYPEEERRRFQSDLEDLYRVRVAADYSAALTIGEADILQVSELSEGIVDLVGKHR